MYELIDAAQFPREGRGVRRRFVEADELHQVGGVLHARCHRLPESRSSAACRELSLVS